MLSFIFLSTLSFINYIIKKYSAIKCYESFTITTSTKIKYRMTLKLVKKRVVEKNSFFKRFGLESLFVISKKFFINKIFECIV